MKRYIYLAATLLAAIATMASCDSGNKQPANDTQNTTDTFYSAGNNKRTNNTGEYQSTGEAALLDVALPAHLDNATVRYKAITVYYNKRLRIPNCVAYELTNTQVAMADAPDAEKRNNYNFNRDNKVAGCPDWWEYKDTGYDRGHMAPAMDMRWNRTAMEQCFLMTNICPQNHDLNDGEWRHMEEAIHTWARSAGRLVIFTGPIVGQNDTKRTGKHHDIAVPQAFYKVVYAPKHDKAIAFIFDNKKAPNSWTNYATTIHEVERRTGINFLASLPDDVETAVETKQNIKNWPAYYPRR